MQKYAGGETAVVATTNYVYSGRPYVAALADGGWLLTWDHAVSNAEESHQQRFDADGEKIGEEVEFSGLGYGVSGLPSGGWVAGQMTMNTAGTDSDTYVSIYDEDGGAVILDSLVNSYTTGFQSFGEITGLADGGWIVTWSGYGEGHDQDPWNDEEIYQQRYDSNGNLVGQNQLVNSSLAGNQVGAEVVALADGGWVVKWISPHDTYGCGIYLQRFDENGNAAGQEERVNRIDLPPAGHFLTGINASMAALADGGWLISWTSGSYSEEKLYQQRYAANGARVGEQIAVGLDGSIYNPQISALPTGGWIVSYSAYDHYESELRAQVFSADGAQVGREIVVDDSYGAHTIATLNDGRFVVTWGVEQSTGIYEIRQRVFSLTENEGPIAADDNLSMVERETLTVNVLTNDADGDNGEKLTLESATVISGNADITFDEDGDIIIQDKSHQLIAGQKATVTIEYAVSDGYETDTGLVSIEIEGTTDGGDQVRGTAKADRYTGFNFDDFYFGLGGNDVIRGRGGDDFLVGGSGRDRINAGDGYNTIVGGTGDDHLSGASDVDVFVFSPGDGRDVVVVNGGGRNSTDVLDLSDFGFRNLNQLKRMVETDGWNLIIDLPGSDQIKIVDGNFYGVNAIV